MSSQLEIIDFSPEYAADFRRLNLEWIEKYFEVEGLDTEQLSDPHKTFIQPGGAIVLGLYNGEVVACCGLVKHDESVYEISKMAVIPKYHGRGFGREILSRIIVIAIGCGAQKLEIISNTVLGPAIALYKSVGFSEVAFNSDAYDRGNIALELDLSMFDVD